MGSVPLSGEGEPREFWPVGACTSLAHGQLPRLIQAGRESNIFPVKFQGLTLPLKEQMINTEGCVGHTISVMLILPLWHKGDCGLWGSRCSQLYPKNTLFIKIGKRPNLVCGPHPPALEEGTLGWI